jgi:hypothetical protein
LTLKSVTCWAPSINTTIFPPAPERYGDSDTLLSSSIYKPTKQEERLALGYKWNWAFSTAVKKALKVMAEVCRFA